MDREWAVRGTTPLQVDADGYVNTDIGKAIVEAGKIHREVWPTWLRAIHDELVK